jgi:phospholipid transport system substrate-binding protein
MKHQPETRFDPFGRGLAFLVTLALCATSFAIVPTTGALAGTDPAHAREMIERVATALAIAQSLPGGIDASRERLAPMLDRFFDMPAIGRWVTGQHWQLMSAEDQQEFQKLFSQWMMVCYSQRFGGHGGPSIKVGKASSLPDGSAVVHSEMKSGKDDARIDWRLIASTPGDPKIIDVSVDGVSMVLAQKSQIASILKNGGVHGLMVTLRDHVQ